MFELIKFLDDTDYSPDGQLYLAKNGLHNPAVVLIYSDQCGNCNTFKPAYDEFSKSMGGILEICAIHANNVSNPAVKALVQRLDKVYPPIRGFPTILFYDQNGVFRAEFNGRTEDRKETLDNLVAWALENHKNATGRGGTGQQAERAQQGPMQRSANVRRNDGWPTSLNTPAPAPASAPTQPRYPTSHQQSSHTNGREKTTKLGRKYTTLGDTYGATCTKGQSCYATFGEMGGS